MKIESNQPTPPPSPVSAKDRKAVEPSRSDATLEPVDSGSISALGKQVLEASPSRVDELRRLYEEGEYSVQPEDIAASLIRDHLKP